MSWNVSTLRHMIIVHSYADWTFNVHCPAPVLKLEVIKLICFMKEPLLINVQIQIQ